MPKFRKKPVIVEAITFDEFVEFGRNNGGNMVSGMPWSFKYKGHPITHENDECYLIPANTGGSERFTPNDMLITGVKEEIYPCPIDIFQKTYDKVNESSPSKLTVSVSVKDAEIFNTLLKYTQSLIEILSDYPLTEEDAKKLNSVSQEFFSLKREVDL